MQTENKYLDVGVISIATANPDKVLLWLVSFSTFPFPKHDNFEDLLAVWIDNEAKHFYWQNLEPYSGLQRVPLCSVKHNDWNTVYMCVYIQMQL